KDNFGYYEPSETEDHNASITEQRRKPDGAKYDQILGDCLAVNKYGNDDDYTNTILYDYEDWICSTARKFESLFGKKMYAC
ncbi:pyruvate formate lyase family protein, partial [Streptococcus gordonii]